MMTTEEMRDIYNAAVRTDEPPRENCRLKEISPNVFAWVKRINDDDGDTTE